MRGFFELNTVIASETKQSIEEMDRRTAFAMTDEDDDDFYDDDEEDEKEWCD